MTWMIWGYPHDLGDLHLVEKLTHTQNGKNHELLICFIYEYTNSHGFVDDSSRKPFRKNIDPYPSPIGRESTHANFSMVIALTPPPESSLKFDHMSGVIPPLIWNKNGQYRVSPRMLGLPYHA